MTYPNISFFSSCKQNKSNETMPLDMFIHATKNGTWQNKIIDVRSAQTKEQQREYKTKLPAVTISGTFSERSKKGLLKHSGYIIIDIDNLEDVDSVKDTLSLDRFVIAIWKSVSGKGLAVMFKIDGRMHLKAFKGIEKYLFETYDILIDPSGKDESRLRYVSFDPDLYENWGAEKFTLYPPEEPKFLRKIPKNIFVQSDFDDIINQIQSRNIDLVDDYHIWVKIGFILADKFGDGGRTYFHIISQPGAKYKYSTCDKQYDHCLRHKGQGVTEATLYWLAKNAGLQIYSEKTKLIATTATQAKKGGRNIADTVKLLKEVENISADESKSIVTQVFENDIDFKSEEGFIYDLENWMRQNYDLKKNEITRKVENDGVAMEGDDFNTIFIDGLKIFDKELKFDTIKRLIHSNFVETYNPIKNWFNANSDRNTTGNIRKIAQSIISPMPIEYVEFFLTKWLIGIVEAVYDVTPPLMLILAGDKQGTGKTEFFRRLLPKELQSYYAESKLDKGKDDDLLMTQKLIIMDDEMSGKSKKDVAHLKSITSKAVFSLREPYGSANVDLKRLALLCGTSNDYNLLSDPTGNRRYVIIHVLNIDRDLYNSIDKTELLIELFNLYKEGKVSSYMSYEDIEYLNSLSAQFEEVSIEKELIQSYFIPAEIGQGVFLSTTEIKVVLEKNSQQRIGVKRLGQELHNLGFINELRKTNDKTKRGYWLFDKSMPTNPIDEETGLPF